MRLRRYRLPPQKCSQLACRSTCAPEQALRGVVDPSEDAFPANAKMTALVCSGRSRPNENHGARFSAGYAICSAMISRLGTR